MDLSFRVRRATTDDLKQLIALWEISRLPALDLEKRFTEFQVAESADGNLVAALAMQIAEKQGKIHSESFSDFALADRIRPVLWQRLQTAAQNHGLVRLWTNETAPFWKQQGFAAASESIAEKMPALFGEKKMAWLSLQLRDEAALPSSIEAEFARFREMEQEKTARVFRHAKTMKWVAAILAIGLFGFVLIGVIYLLKQKPKQSRFELNR